MKLFFISDIHGSVEALNKALAAFEQEQADQLVLLGDLLYHGPRNRLPEQYDPQAVAHKLNEYKQHIIAVRGNCDAEVDQMLIQFPILADYALVFLEGKRLYVTHGHLASMDHLPALQPGDLFIQGHTHVPVAEKKDGIIVMNPGSISLPKGGFPPSYGVMDKQQFKVIDFQGTILKSIALY